MRRGEINREGERGEEREGSTVSTYVKASRGSHVNTGLFLGVCVCVMERCCDRTNSHSPLLSSPLLSTPPPPSYQCLSNDFLRLISLHDDTVVMSNSQITSNRWESS